jgi:predicted acyl esterase
MPGHRIRLDVSSSNFPRFDVNPNMGETIGRDRRRVVARLEARLELVVKADNPLNQLLLSHG